MNRTPDPVEHMLEGYFLWLKRLVYTLKTSKLSYSRYICLRGRQVLTTVADQ